MSAAKHVSRPVVREPRALALAGRFLRSVDRIDIVPAGPQPAGAIVRMGQARGRSRKASAK